MKGLQPAWTDRAAEMIALPGLRSSAAGEGATELTSARWGAGFLLNRDNVYGPSSATFGHSGWAGSFAKADPATGVGIGYLMKRRGTDIIGDPRDQAIIAAV